MHPVLAQETIHDLSTRHHRQIEAAIERNDQVTAMHLETGVTPVWPRLRTASGGALAALVALTKRRAWYHP